MNFNSELSDLKGGGHRGPAARDAATAAYDSRAQQAEALQVIDLPPCKIDVRTPPSEARDVLIQPLRLCWLQPAKDLDKGWRDRVTGCLAC